MKILIVTTLVFAFTAGLTLASPDCESKAVSAEGKPLFGAAKAAFIKKCQKDAAAELKTSCEAKAVSKDGKPLAGAAKTASIKKCMSGAQ